jgi:hypothetical protein
MCASRPAAVTSPRARLHARTPVHLSHVGPKPLVACCICPLCLRSPPPHNVCHPAARARARRPCPCCRDAPPPFCTPPAALTPGGMTCRPTVCPLRPAPQQGGRAPGPSGGDAGAATRRAAPRPACQSPAAGPPGAAPLAAIVYLSCRCRPETGRTGRQKGPTPFCLPARPIIPAPPTAGGFWSRDAVLLLPLRPPPPALAHPPPAARAGVARRVRRFGRAALCALHAGAQGRLAATESIVPRRRLGRALFEFSLPPCALSTHQFRARPGGAACAAGASPPPLCVFAPSRGARGAGPRRPRRMKQPLLTPLTPKPRSRPHPRADCPLGPAPPPPRFQPRTAAASAAAGGRTRWTRAPARHPTPPSSPTFPAGAECEPPWPCRLCHPTARGRTAPKKTTQMRFPQTIMCHTGAPSPPVCTCAAALDTGRAPLQHARARARPAAPRQAGRRPRAGPLNRGHGDPPRARACIARPCGAPARVQRPSPRRSAGRV